MPGRESTTPCTARPESPSPPTGHRRHAVVELAIRDLKEGSGLEHCPSGDFNANADWAVLVSIAHNLVRWVAALGLELTGPLVVKTIRRKFIALAGRLTHGARRRHVHLRSSGPGPRSGAAASSGSSNYRPNRFGLEVTRATSGDFQREEVTKFTELVTRHVRRRTNTRTSENHDRARDFCFEFAD